MIRINEHTSREGIHVEHARRTCHPAIPLITVSMGWLCLAALAGPRALNFHRCTPAGSFLPVAISPYTLWNREKDARLF